MIYFDVLEVSFIMDKNTENNKKKRNYKKVLTVILCVFVVLGVSGVICYKKLIEPIIDQKLDVVIATLDSISNNEETQRKIDSVVQSMIEDGVITEESIPRYMKMMKENEANWNEEKIVEELKAAAEENENTANTGNLSVAQGENDSQAANAAEEKATQTQKENNASVSESTKGQTTSASSSGAATSTQTSTATSAADDKAATEQQSSGGSSKDLRTRMKEAMTASEFAFASSMYGKIDLGYAQSLYAQDKAAAKEYIYSRVSSSEISRALEIYAKYAYLVG